MGVCLSGDTPAGSWVVGRPLLNAANETHALFFQQNDYTSGRSAMEAIIPALHMLTANKYSVFD